MRIGTIALMGAGGLFLWSGFHGASITGSLRDLVSGQPASSTNLAPLGGSSGLSGSPGTSSSPGAGDTSAHSPSAASNQALAKMLAISLGHPTWTTGQQWADWVSLWNQESGWSTTALNSGSGATGIPQLLPSAHPVPANWSSATVQITWGINYIAQTYGSPSAAWSHEQANNWY